MSLYRFWLGPQGWKALWVALLRSRRDPTARVQLLRLLCSLLVLSAFFTFYGFYLRGLISEMDRGGVVVFLGLVVFVLALTGGFSLHYWWDARTQETTDPSVSVELKRDLFRETVLLGTLLERLGSEVAMEKELPANISIITRRVMLDRLEELGIRHDLEPWLLDLLLAPDGHWTAEQKERALGAWECFAVLNWILGLGELRGLTSQPDYSVDAVRALCAIEKPDRLRVLPSWDIRPARDVASRFFNRCWGELLARQEVPDASKELVKRALEVRSEIAREGYLHDYLIGAKTIPELETQFLWVLALRAYRRWELLSILVSIVSEEQQVTGLRQFLAGFFTSSETVASDPITAAQL